MVRPARLKVASVEELVARVQAAAEDTLADRDIRFERGSERPLGDKGRRTRAAILRAATEAFTQLGWRGTSIAVIADRAGVGVGTMYQYFRAKEDVIATLVAEWTLQALSDIRAWDPREGVEDLARLIRTFVNTYAATAPFQRLWEEVSLTDPDLDRLRSALTEVFVHLFAEAFSTGASVGLLDPGREPVETARALIGMIERYCLEVFVRRPDATTPDRAADLLSDLTLAALRA
jgi:AcrR family transcriptional regulator